MEKIHSFTIITFGCRTNQAESRQLAEILSLKGWQPLETKKEKNQPTLVIINSCAVTAKAEKEVRQTIRQIKKKNPKTFLVVIGCWVNKIKKEKKDVKVDLLLTNQEKEKLAKILEKKFTFNGENYQEYQDKYGFSGKALVKIQDGCDQFCSYCLVPYLRGSSISRPAAEIIKEIKNLEKKEIKEIVLTGINMASYCFKFKESKKQNLKAKKNDLVKLIKLILKQTKIRKLSFGSLNFEVFDEDFLALYEGKYQNRLSSHFHIPLQAGSNRTLQKMRRKYQAEEFESLLLRLKQKIPAFTFSTDLIVGFPGETKRDFQETLSFLKKIKKRLDKSFVKIHLFRYSSRPGTLAAKLEGQLGWEKVSEKEKKQRLKLVKKLNLVYN